MPKPPHIELIARGILIEPDAHGTPRLLVCVALVNTDSHGNPGYAFLPGGHIEFGESAPTALAREMLEECNVAVTVGPLLLTHESVFKAKRTHHEINTVFAMSRRAADARKHLPITSREDHIEFRFVTLAELKRLRLLPPECRQWLIKHWPALTATARPAKAATPAWLSGVGRD